MRSPALLCAAAFAFASVAACGPADAGDDAGDADITAAPADPAVWQQQVIYLAIPDRFSNGDSSNDSLGEPGCNNPGDPNLFHGGDLKGLKSKVSYLSQLGTTALWITPLAKQVALHDGACGYHGYWADYSSPDDGAIEPKLGTLAEAKALRAALHAAGMKFIIDLVINHTGRNAALATSVHPEWFHNSSNCAALGNSQIYCPLNGLPDFAQENPQVATYLTALSRGWVTRLKPDGIRMDTAVNVLPSYFQNSFVPGVRSAANLFLLAEVFDGGPFTGHIKPILDTGFDSTFNYPLHFILAQAFAQAGSMDLVADSINSAIAQLGLARTRMLTTMLDNHDVPRFLQSADPSTPQSELASRYALAMTALFTLPGIPQLYAGDELGANDADNRRDMPAGAWTQAGRAALGAGFLPHADQTFARVQKLIAIRKANDALYAGDYTESWRPNGASTNALLFTRQTPGETIVVAINAGTKATGGLSIRAKVADGSVLSELLNEGAPQTITAQGGRLAVSLPAQTSAIYRFRN